MNRYSNTAFIPQTSAITPGQAAVAQLYNKNPDTEIFSTGVYNWANSDRDPQCSDEASRIFGSNLIDPEDSDYAALMIGNAVLTRSGCSGNPEAYFRAQGWTVPTGYGDYTNLTRMAGQRIIQQARTNYDDYQKRLAEYRKAMTDTLNTLPHEITNSIYRSGALGADALFRAKKLSPEYLENISKFYDKDKAVESHQRALTAWTSFSGFMHSTDSLQSMTREDLRDIAAILTDETGQTDLLALSVLALLVERRATAMQSENPEAWSIFSDSLQNWGSRLQDQDAKEKASKWNKMVQGWKDAGIDQNMIDHFFDKRYNDETVETLYGSLQHALDTSLSPSEKADWLAKTMASAAKVTGESIVPSLAALGIGIASRGAGYGTAASIIGSYATNVAINSNSLINAAVAEAYRTGKVNPETYGRQEGSAQAISEGAFDLGTTFPGASKIIGKITNKAAATAAGSRFLTNQYARATLNYLGSGMIQGFGELAEEELSGKIAASLNTLARENGIVLTPRQYSFGEALRSMKSYEIAGIFGYTWALGMFGIPANYRAARTYAQNTDNLLKAGHSPAAVRDIQSHLFETEDKISAVYADNSLSKAEKQKQVDKLNQDFFNYQQQKAQSDIWDVDPEIIRKRLEKENKKTLTEAELALTIRNNIHTQIFKDAGIIDSTALPGDKHKLTFIQPGEKKEDGTEAPARITTQEWSNNQLVNWLQIKEAGLLDNSLRKFQALVQAHAGAQTITMGDLVIEFQNMRDTPLAAFAALQKHNAMSEEYIKEMAVTARNMLQSSMDNGMTAQEAAQQPSGILRGVSLGEVAKLDTAIAQRKEQATQTSEGKDKGISADTSVSFPAMNLRRADGSYLIAYVSGDTNINDMLEDMLETHIKHQLNTGQLTRNQLAAFLKEVDSHLPGKSILPKNKTDYSMSDLVEAYSSLALAHYLYNEQYLPLTQGGHQLMRNIGRVVDTARVLKTLGDSWFTYANSPEGKAYLANGGKDLMTIMQEAGFTFGNILAQARATAQQEQEVIEARNWEPAIEDELDALLEEAEAEQQLAEINQQEAQEPITIPAEQSITGQPITVEPEPRSFGEASLGVERPETGSDEAGTTPELYPAAHLLSLIQQGNAKTQHFARFFRDNPSITDAQATELGIRPLTQRGNPTATYTQGRLIAANLTPQQFEDYLNDKLKGKALKQALSKPGTFLSRRSSVGAETEVPTTATFSIKPATDNLYDRFTVDPLGERIVHTVRTEARRYARVLGDKTPQEQAMNAIASAESIIMAVDKYLHRPDKPVSRRHRNQLTKLRSIIEKYAQIIASGTPRSFKRISPAEQQELQAAIAELEAAELDTAETDPASLIEDSDRTTKRTRDARAAELRRRIVREAAKGRVYKVLAAMLDTAADALDDYLKDQLLTKLHRLTATVAIKRTPSKRLKGKMTAPAYRELEQAIQLMAYSTRQKEDAVENILSAHETLAQAIASNEDNLIRGNTLLIELARRLEQEGTPVTAQTLTAALAAHEARVAIFADITSKNYEQTRTAANAIYHIIRYGRALWQQKHEAREENIQKYLQYFLANTTAEQGTEQATRTAIEKEQKESGLTRFANSMMNSMQLFHALSGFEALAPLMEHTQRSLATANVARDLHMKQMVTHVQAVYGRILGIKPATEAGYSDKQLEKISKELDKFYAENNQREATGITRHYIDADGKHKQEELELTKWQALDLILTYRQQHYRPNAEHHGYTDKVLDSLEKWCGTDLMELGEAMQKSIINDGTIAVCEEREGIPLRENPFYWPGHLNIAEQDAPDHPVISNPYHGASSYKFLKGRTNNLREVSARNAYNVWKSAIAERANYIYLAPVTDIFNSLLARKEFAARLKPIIGPSLYNQLKETLREIDGTTWAETSLQEDPHNAVARALRNMAPALLAGNPTTLIRQASAVANATLMPDFPPHEFAKQLVQLQQNQSGITIGRITRLPVFQARARDNSALNEMLALGTDAKYSSYANLARKFMGYIDEMDTFCNAVGATIYYNYKYEQYTRENNENGNILTDAEIHAKCENDIAIMLALTAQPLKRTDKSAFFWRNSKTVLGPLYLYMGSELINKVGMARANWIKRKAEGMGSIKNTSLWLYSLGAGVGAVAFLTELAVAYLTGNTPDDDDSLSAWLIATYLNSAYGQYTSQMPVIGQITDLFTSPYSALFSTTSQIPGVKTIQSGKKIGKMLTDNKVYSVAEWQSEITRLARDLNGVAGYAGGINSHMPWLTVTSSILQSITTAMNIANFFSTGVRNEAFYADWFPDWYKETGTRKRKPRRSKSLIEKALTPDEK